MGRGPQILSAQQQAMLNAARAAKIALDKADREARAEVEEMLDRRLTPLRARVALSVLDAISHGVPKARVNLEVLGVTTPNAWARWAEQGAAFKANPNHKPYSDDRVPEPPSEPQFAEVEIKAPAAIEDGDTHWPLPASLTAHEHASRLSFVGDPADRRLRVAWSGYVSTAQDAPPTLVGVVEYDPSSPTHWRVVEDPQDKQTAFGVETGALTFEVEQRRGAVPLREALASFVAAANLPRFEAVGLDVDDDDDEDGGDGF